MDTTTYDGIAKTVTIQSPTPAPVVPAPVVYTLDQLNGYIALEQSNMTNIDTRIAALRTEKATHQSRIDAWQVYVDGIGAAAVDTPPAP